MYTIDAQSSNIVVPIRLIKTFIPVRILANIVCFPPYGQGICTKKERKHPGPLPKNIEETWLGLCPSLLSILSQI